LVADLATKYGVFAWLPPGRAHVVIPRCFSLIHQDSLNQGALFGFGNDPETGWIANLIFACISAIAAFAIGLWSFRERMAHDRVLCIALGLILGGALGNLYDRIVFKGVRDWIWVYYEDAAGALAFNFPVFNLADSCLVCGASLLLLQAFFAAPEPKAGPTGDAATPQVDSGV
jgi:lipoprotein signal peptidase